MHPSRTFSEAAPIPDAAALRKRWEEAARNHTWTETAGARFSVDSGAWKYLGESQTFAYEWLKYSEINFFRWCIGLTNEKN